MHATIIKLRRLTRAVRRQHSRSPDRSTGVVITCGQPRPLWITQLHSWLLVAGKLSEG